MKRLILFIWLCPMVLIARAQWTAKDSLNLQRILNGQEDIKLNMDAVKQIDFPKTHPVKFFGCIGIQINSIINVIRFINIGSKQRKLC